METAKAHYHLPGLFEFFEFYKIFLPLFFKNREWFYSWCDIASIYGSPSNCAWGGGRIENDGNAGSISQIQRVKNFVQTFGISSRLAFSNSLLEAEHLSDRKCNSVCSIFERRDSPKHIQNGVIVHSDVLLDYLKKKYPDFYFVSSTTKVITDFSKFKSELARKDFRYVVPDFRLNKRLDELCALSQMQKDKVEFLCNECCWTGCPERKECYESVSRQILENCSGCAKNTKDFSPHICASPNGKRGYRFSDAMRNPSFISLGDIQNVYLTAGFSNFKIEGRSLGSALLLEFLLYYMTKPEFHINVREELYLDNTLDLF